MTDELQTTAPVESIPEDLQVWEEAREASDEVNPERPAPRFNVETAKDAARLMARMRHFETQKRFFAEPFDEEITRLQAQIAELQAQKAKVEAQWDNRAAWYRSSLEVWARQQNEADPKLKTINLPYGSLKVRAQQPEWTYDDAALLAYLQANRPELVRTKVEPNKVDLKKAVQVNGAHALDPQTGEIIPGVTITERPPKFELEVAG
jgi:hypothetical protein